MKMIPLTHSVKIGVETYAGRLLKQNDKTDFDCLYDAYAPALYGMIASVTPDAVLASAILEKSFLTFRQNSAAYDASTGTLFIGLVRITLRQCDAILGLSNGTAVKNLLQKIPFYNIPYANG